MGVASAFSGFRVHLAVLVFHKGLSISGTLLVFVLAWLNRVSLKIKTFRGTFRGSSKGNLENSFINYSSDPKGLITYIWKNLKKLFFLPENSEGTFLSVFSVAILTTNYTNYIPIQGRSKPSLKYLLKLLFN